jgi:hypothetical protein
VKHLRPADRMRQRRRRAARKADALPVLRFDMSNPEQYRMGMQLARAFGYRPAPSEYEVTYWSALREIGAITGPMGTFRMWSDFDPRKDQRADLPR